jgi:predicted nucleic acid-binding protein
VAEVFADTSGWATYFIRTEPLHVTARKLIRQWEADGTRVITTNYILAELVTILTSRFREPRSSLVAYADTIRTAPWVEIVHIDPALDAEAWDLLRARPDKEWSLVDCASFVVMQHRGITEALTTDHHFEQAGFVRLLK